MPKLIHSLEGALLRNYPLSQGKIRFGRRSDNDIQLDDLAVSGRHAIITITESPYMKGLLDCRLEDLGSTNGTLVNGRAIRKPCLLKHMDIVKIGTHELCFIDEKAMDFESTRILIRDDGN